MKTFSKVSMAIAMYMLMAIAGVSMAHGQVTVTYQTFPPITVMDKNVVSGCVTATANTYYDYQFEFWDNQGTISFSPTVSICAGSGKSVAIAWYLPTGGVDNCPPTGCYVSTMAYSDDHHEFLTSGTPIEMVTPDSPVVWTAGSTTVNTSHGPESISAKSGLKFPPLYKSDPFRFWQEMGTSKETSIGIVYQASLNDTALVVAFYGPDPCQKDRTQLQTCEEEFPTDPKACAPFAAVLNYCEKQNREIP